MLAKSPVFAKATTAQINCVNARLTGERMGFTSFQKSTVAAARFAMPSGVNSKRCFVSTGRSAERTYLVDLLVRSAEAEPV